MKKNVWIISFRVYHVDSKRWATLLDDQRIVKKEILPYYFLREN